MYFIHVASKGLSKKSANIKGKNTTIAKDYPQNIKKNLSVERISECEEVHILKSVFLAISVIAGQKANNFHPI